MRISGMNSGFNYSAIQNLPAPTAAGETEATTSQRSKRKGPDPAQMQAQLTQALGEQGFSEADIKKITDTLEATMKKQRKSGESAPPDPSQMQAQLTQSLGEKGFSEADIEKITDTFDAQRKKQMPLPSNGMLGPMGGVQVDMRNLSAVNWEEK